MYYMSESVYFINLYNGLYISVYSWQFCHLLFTLTWPFFYPFYVIPYLFIDNNNTAMCVDMPLEQEGSACHTSHHHTQPQCPSLIYRWSVSPWCLTGSTLPLMFINTLIRIMYHKVYFLVIQAPGLFGGWSKKQQSMRLFSWNIPVSGPGRLNHMSFFIITSQLTTL